MLEFIAAIDTLFVTCNEIHFQLQSQNLNLSHCGMLLSVCHSETTAHEIRAIVAPFNVLLLCTLYKRGREITIIICIS